MTIRGILLWIHLALGLTGAVIIAIVSVTGAYITFQPLLFRWINPVPRVAPSPAPADIQAIVAAVEARFAPGRVMSLDIASDGRASVAVLRNRTEVFVDPADASIVGARPRRFASLANLTLVMRRLHTSLLLGERGRLIVTAATAEAILLVLTGLWLWWRKKQWRWGAWRGSPFRVSWDLHSATGIWFAIPALAMVVTGVLIAHPGPVYRVAGAAPAPWQWPPPSRVPEGTSRESITLARAMAIADSVIPTGTTNRINIPSGAGGTVGVRKDRTTVYIDQFSGAVIDVRPDRVLTAGDHAYQVVESVHTGARFGWPGMAIMTAGCVMLVVMTVTGVILGWKRLMILAGRWNREAGPQGAVPGHS